MTIVVAVDDRDTPACLCWCDRILMKNPVSFESKSSSHEYCMSCDSPLQISAESIDYSYVLLVCTNSGKGDKIREVVRRMLDKEIYLMKLEVRLETMRL